MFWYNTNIYSSVYVANVTSNTTGEVLLKEFETGVSEYEPCKLVYNGKDIRPTDTLGKLGIKKGDLVKVIWSVWENSLTIHPSLVGEAKEATRSSIEDQSLENVPIHRQFLIFADKKLHNYQTLSYYNIQKKSTLHLRSKAVIFVKMKTEKSIELEAETSDTINQIKQKSMINYAFFLINSVLLLTASN
ncbi:ubiquitin-related domain-containing protein [Rhizophagus irregularis DAOM 181602=DAOM 197198]|nr:ubiquitin-related domain-containing protein [Rhizophagus irregularis DAOM 181602=DAOM 197198]